MRALGRRHVDGHVLNAGGETTPTPTEEAFFAAAGLPCLPPRARDQFAGELEVARMKVKVG